MATFSAGSASVNIVPDFRGAHKAIGAWFAGMDDIKLNVDPQINPRDLAQMHRSVNAGPKPSLKIDIDYKHFGHEVVKLTDFFVGLSIVNDVARTVFGPKSVLMTTGIGALTAIAGAAGQSLGTIGLIPAGVAAAAVPIATLVVGLRGMGDAFKALASGDIEKTNAAMANLAPSARNFVREAHSLAPAMKELRLDVQQELFRGLGREVKFLGRQWLPMLDEALKPVATSLREMASGVIGVLAMDQNVNAFAETIDNVAQTTAIWGRAMSPITQMFIDLTTVGSQFLPGMASGFAEGANAAAKWVANARETGKLTDIFRAALDSLKQIVNLLVNVGQLLFQVFRAGAETGGTLLQVLNQLVGGIAAFLATPIGQSGLVTFFSNIGSAVQSLTPGLMALVQALVTGVLPAMSGLVAAIAPVVDGVLIQLADLITRIAPLFYPAMADAIGAMLSALAPLIPVISDIAAIILPILADVLIQLAPVVAEIAETIGTALLGAVQIIAPLLPQLGDAFILILEAVLPLLPQLLQLAVGLLPPLVDLMIALVPVIIAAAEAFAPMASTLLNLLAPALGGIVSAISTVLMPILGFMADNIYLVIGAIAAWQVVSLAMSAVAFVKMAGGLSGVLVKMALYIGQLNLVRAATVVWTAVQWALNFAMNANPIGIIVLVLAALAAAVIYAYTHFQWFRDVVTAVWGAIQTAAQWAWENVLKPVFEAIASVATWLYDNVLHPVFTAISAAWSAMVTAAQWAWNNILKPVWDVIQTAATVLFRILVVVVFGAIMLAWTALTTAARWAWENVLKPVWDAIQTAALWLWENGLKPIWDAMQRAWDGLLVAFRWIWETILKPVWDAIAAAAGWLWNTILRPIWDAMKSAWDGLLAGMSWVYDHVLKPVWDAITGAVQVVQKAFEAVVEGIRKAWDTLMDIVSTPINFVIEVIFNRGLFTAWNWAIDKLGLPAEWRAPHWDQLPRGHHFATGGTIPGAGDEDNVPIYATPGEFMVQKRIAVKTRPFLEALNAGEAEAVQAAGGWYANGPRIGYAAGGNIAGALDHARHMQGKPYIWGGVGPAGADCSGFMSQIVNVLRGLNPYRRVGTTATFPWPGFTSGFGTPFTIGNTKNAFGSGVGHMAGSLEGHRVESGSGHGPMLDGVALGANAPLFGMHGWLSQIAGAEVAKASSIDTPWYQSLWGSITGAFDWLKEKVAAVTQMVGRFGDNPFVRMVGEVPVNLVSKLWGKIKGAVTALFTHPIDFAPNTGGVVDAVKGAARPYGWDVDPQWAAIDWIVNKESGWRPTAQNATSTASGLFQMIDGTWRSYRPPSANNVAHMREASYADQATAGLRYMRTRYGSPVGAKQFHLNNGWYDNGGWLPPGVSTIYNGTGRPEPVLTAAEHDALMRWQGERHHGRGGDRQFMGDVHFHGVDERTRTAIMDDLWHRMRVASRGGVHTSTSVYAVG